MPVSPAYTSVSFYTRFDVAYYAINDRAAGRRVIELDLMTAEQRSELPDDEEVTAADRLIVELPTQHRLDRDPGAGARAGLMPARAARSLQRALPPAELQAVIVDDALTSSRSCSRSVARAPATQYCADARVQQRQRALALDRQRRRRWITSRSSAN